MILQAQSLTTHILLPSILPTTTTHFSRQSSSLSLSKTTSKIQFGSLKPYRSSESLFRRPLRCSASVVTTDPKHLELTKTAPAEVSRTIMELSSVGTLSSLSPDGWPLGVGVRFAVDSQGTPILCLNPSQKQFSIGTRSSLHVQLEQCGLRTPQCTIQGKLDKPEDGVMLKKLHSQWTKRFEEEVDENLIYVVAVERVLQIEDFKEDGVWVSSLDYKTANPDPLRDCAEKIVGEINTHNMEDIHRFCNVYVDMDFQVAEAKMVWVDRLGFDMRIYTPQSGTFEVRIPFPRQVTDEKGAKSSFNCMSQLAWEVEKNFHVPDFDKVKKWKTVTATST